ncbi:MAG: zinc ribbon domain-containing protein [Candidatus Micrarchaeota archaeon]
MVDKCESCGMPIMHDDVRGGGKKDNKYCLHCTDEEGNLKSREDVREGMIQHYIRSMAKPREAAEEYVDEHMKNMPAWKEG